jgi:hypothetical protein
MGEMKKAYNILVGNPQGVNGTIISKWILKKQKMRAWSGFISFKIRTYDRLL